MIFQKIFTRIIFFAVSAVLILCRPAFAIPTYAVTDLGTLGGSRSYAFGVNDLGQVVGESDLSGDLHSHAFLFKNGVLVDVGTLGGADSSALGINNAGLIVGEARTTSGASHAFYSVGGNNFDMGNLGAAAGGGVALAVNSAGVIVGETATTQVVNFQQIAHAFSYSGGGMVDLGTFSSGNPSYSDAHGINDYGQIVGSATKNNDSESRHAFLYMSGVMSDLGTLGGKESLATAINNFGYVVGYSALNFTGQVAEHAFLYSASVGMVDIGVLGGLTSIAWAINDFGQVVGWSSRSGNMEGHAFIYESGVMQDLNDLVDPMWTITDARDINNNGMIVGSGRIGSGAVHAVLLTPVSASQIPEPSSMLLVSVAMLGLFKRKGI